MSNRNLVMGWATLAGIALLGAALLGFLNTSIVGDSANALVRTDTIHNIVHAITGALALYIAFGLRGESQTTALLGFGILYVVIFVAVLASPNLFGLFKVDANAAVHVIHGAVAVVSLAVGYMARGASTTMAR